MISEKQMYQPSVFLQASLGNRQGFLFRLTQVSFPGFEFEEEGTRRICRPLSHFQKCRV